MLSRCALLLCVLVCGAAVVSSTRLIRHPKYFSEQLNVEGLSSSEVDTLVNRVDKMMASACGGAGGNNIIWDKSKDWTGPGQSGGAPSAYTYYYNPCGVTNNVACKGYNSNIQICQSGNQEVYSIGNVGGGTWSVIPGGIQQNFSNGDTCNANGQTYTRFGSMNFQCGSATTGTFLMIEPVTLPPCTFYTQMASAICAGGDPGCTDPDGCVTAKPSLSGGSIFLIIFFCCIPVYVLVGCAFNFKQRGLRGVEACPQYEFWRDLPSLCLAGCMFLVSKCRSLCTGGGGSTKTDFEPIP